MIKLVHVADVHFDSPFSMLTIQKSEIRRREIRSSFEELIKYVHDEKVQLLLVAGDLFDSAYVSRETAEMLRREFASVPECRIVIAPGNHDPYNESSIYKRVRFSDNVYIFNSEEITSFDFPEINCTVYGYAFTSAYMEASPLCSLPEKNPERINILLAHGDTTSPISRYCPLYIRDIELADFDYTALGHIHNTDGIHITAQRKYYAYSGCFEGRGFDETGKCGVIEAELDKDCNKLSFTSKSVYFSKRIYESVKLDITGCENQTQIAEKIKALVSEQGYGEETALRVVLEGNIEPLVKIYPSYISEQISGLFTLQIIDESLPLLDSEKLESDMSVKGAFYDKLKPLLESNDASVRRVAALALRYGLTALAGDDPVDFV